MSRWGYLDDAQSVDCDCGEPHTIAHLLSCRLLDEACTADDLATVTQRAMACAPSGGKIVWRTRKKEDQVIYTSKIHQYNRTPPCCTTSIRTVAFRSCWQWMSQVTWALSYFWSPAVVSLTSSTSEIRSTALTNSPSVPPLCPAGLRLWWGSSRNTGLSPTMIYQIFNKSSTFR